jgi:hypothetical protein
MKRILISLLALVYAGNAYADCASDLVSGAKLSSTTSQVLCATFGSAATQSLIPDTDNAYDLGSTSKGFRTAYLGTNLTFNGVTATTNLIGTSSVNGADSNILHINSAGGLPSAARGANLSVYGNEAAGTPGLAQLVSGDTAGADINLSSIDDITYQPGQTTKWTMDETGQFIGAGTASIGWSVVNVANQACNTTCTAPCVVGIDTLGTGGFLACATATADSCICAGAS